jgi:hypothetical protein
MRKEKYKNRLEKIEEYIYKRGLSIDLDNFIREEEEKEKKRMKNFKIPF